MFLITATLSSALCAAPATFDLDFDGGTVAQWVTSIRAVTSDANIVVDGAAEDAVVPAMHLHGVTVDGVMLVSEQNAASVINCFPVSSSGAPIWVVSPKVPRSVARGASRSSNRSPSTRSGGNELFTEVFTLPEGYRSRADAERLVDAVKTAALLDTEHPLHIRPMPDMGLIAVRGSVEQVATARSMVELLHKLSNRNAPGVEQADAAADP